MKCANCQSERTTNTTNGKRLVCLDCGESVELQGDEQHAGDRQWSADVERRLDALETPPAVSPLEGDPSVDPPEDPPAVEEGHFGKE